MLQGLQGLLQVVLKALGILDPLQEGLVWVMAQHACVPSVLGVLMLVGSLVTSWC
jgi:hypothetical protein